MSFASRNPSQLSRIRDSRRLADALDGDSPERDDANSEWKPATKAGGTHSGSHENGGDDEVSVAGLSGDLADPQDAKAHAASHENGGGDAMTVDAAAGTGSLRTIGSGARQAAAGDHGHGSVTLAETYFF